MLKKKMIIVNIRTIDISITTISLIPCSDTSLLPPNRVQNKKLKIGIINIKLNN